MSLLSMAKSNTYDSIWKRDDNPFHIQMNSNEINSTNGLMRQLFKVNINIYLSFWFIINQYFFSYKS